VKILQICHRVPFPPVDGGNIAMMNLALSLAAAGNKIDQFCLNTSRHYSDIGAIPAEIKNKISISASPIDTRIKPLGAFLNLFGSESYNISRFYSASVEADLIALLKKEDFDIVQIETLYPTPYIDAIRKNSKAKIVLRAHNVEHIIWERLSVSEKNPIKKKYLSLLAKRLKAYELNILTKVDAIIPITSIDEKHFRHLGYKGPMISLPLGVDLEEYQRETQSVSEMSLVHLGSMDWLPNREGVEWFLKECWQSIHQKFPSLRLYLAGRDFPQEIIDLKPDGVTFHGRVDNANEYISGKQIMIVPLHSGSGMRVKIIQGLALGRTIISTTIGAEGIEVTDQQNILIADTPEDFLRLITRCIENPEWCRSIGKNALQLARDKYSNASIGNKETEFLKSLR
jgi:glycosyltransferase involved in cell wall biosynthesis